MMSDEEAAEALVKRVQARENPPKPTLEDEPVLLLSERQIAHRLSISARSVRRMDLPRYRIGRSVRYKMEDVDKYLKQHMEYPISVYRSMLPASSKRPRSAAYPALPTWEEVQARVRREDERKGLPRTPKR